MRNMAILVTSCQRDRGAAQTAIRKTWGDTGKPVFFLGEPRMQPWPDEVFLRVSDTYSCVPFKTHGMCWYAMKKLLDYVFICDVDTYVDVEMLYKYPIYQHNYIGHRCDEGHASGGNGYWLSSYACWLLAMEEPPLGYADMWVGKTLEKHGVKLHHDPAYGNGEVTKHLGQGTGNYDPKWMYEEHDRRLACKKSKSSADTSLFPVLST